MTTILGASLWWRMQVELEFVVASTLFLYLMIRVSPRLHGVLQHSVLHRKRSWLAIIGIIHGLSNLGGGLLAIFAANSFGDKLNIRNYIAFCYLCFAVIQLMVLAALAPHAMRWAQLAYAAVGGAIFIACEWRVFGSLSLSTFDRAFTIVIGSYSVLLFLKLAGVLSVVSAT